MRWRGLLLSAVSLVCAVSARAPVLADDSLHAVAAVAEQSPARALELLDALAPDRRGVADVRYLRARVLEDLGQDGAALAALPTDVAALPVAVATDVERRRVGLLARLGRCTDAAPAIAALVRTGRADASVGRTVVECALARGDVEAARTELDMLARKGADTFALRVRLADVWIAQGARDEAVRTLKTLLVADPAHPGAGEAEQRLALLGALTFAAKERIARAECFSEARRYDAALTELDAVPVPRAGKERAEILHLRGSTLFDMRTRYLEAAETLEAAAKAGGPTEAFDAFHAARARSRAGQDRRAIAAYRAFARRHPASRYAGEARYLAAWLELRLGLPVGERNMQRFLDDREDRKLGDLARSGRFELALRAFERRRHREAERLFGETAREAESPMDRARGHYWAGRAAEARRRPAEATVHYREALSPEPLGWYALLARGRLRVLDADPGAPFDTIASDRAPSPAPPLLDAALPDDVAFYARLGLRNDAIAALRATESRFGANEAGIAALVRAYHALGEHARPHVLVAGHRDALRRPPARDNAWAWEAAYARPHEALVAEAAAQAGVEPALVHAVMRKESGFDPRVVSYADAIGLMQLLPETAEKVAAERGEAFRREALFDPETNVRWGAHLLGTLGRELGDEPVLVLAAYNAGTHRVLPWLEREAKRGRVDVDHFVERIPIEQTRNYVRRVVGNWARYAYLADPARGWPFELPTHLPSHLPSSVRRRR